MNQTLTPLHLGNESRLHTIHESRTKPKLHACGNVSQTLFPTVRILITLLLLMLSVFPTKRAFSADYYVAPTAETTGNGSITSPWKLANALKDNTNPASPNSAVTAGDTIWLRGGTYMGPFTSYLAGTTQNPITIRQFPGERATIDGAAHASSHTLTVYGSNVIYRDFEVTNSKLDRTVDRPFGLYVLGQRTRLVNLVIHDVGTGIGLWTEAPDTEVSGCIIYNNGYQAADPDRGHGHGIYLQNNTGAKLLRGNIIFNQFGKGIQAYTKEGFLRNITISSNIIFNNGLINRNQQPEDNILVGGYEPAANITIADNVSYSKFTGGVENRFGYSNFSPTGALFGNDNLVVKGNYFIGGGAHHFIYWTNAVVTQNVFQNNQATIVYKRPSTHANVYWDKNIYYSGGAWGVETTYYNFTQWTNATGFDVNSQKYTESAATGAWTKVFIDDYNRGRATISIINWDMRDNIPIDMTDVLVPGDQFTIKHAQDWFGAPVLIGNYLGGTVNFPMTNLNYALPVGVTNHPGASWPKFGAFVVMRTSANAPLPPGALRILP